MRYCLPTTYDGPICKSCLYPPKIPTRFKVEKLPDMIYELVCDYFKTSRYDPKTKSRKGELVVVRQITMSLVSEFTDLSLKRIGAIFKRDHTTVINAKNRVDDLCFSDKKYKATYDKLKNDVEIMIKKHMIETQILEQITE